MSGAAFADGHDYRSSIEGVAHDIAGLKGRFSQLQDFSLVEHVRASELKISYRYHVRAPGGRGGWTSAVPRPDDDGIWFYIDFQSSVSGAIFEILERHGVRPCGAGRER